MSGAAQAAIVGMACRLPGGIGSPAELWEKLVDGFDAIGPAPAGRFDAERLRASEPRERGRLATIEGGFLNQVEWFDAAFFGISPREAKRIDPQQRLLLEVAWEALEDAGVPATSLAGRPVGVYVALWTGDYESVLHRRLDDLDLHAISGVGRYAAAGRLSHVLDVRGPSLTVDAACSGSLVALHLARQALLSGEIEVALVGAANLILQPQVSVGYSVSGMLSPGGRCRFGDAVADGYVRSEGVAALVLRRAADARAARQPIRALLLGTGVNSDGRASGQLGKPSEAAQAELLRTVYRRAGIAPGAVAYVEAHGTGTRAGDPTELGALGSVLGRARPRGRPLLVGSIKTNIGHTEACAGLAGVIKTTLALEHRLIPPSLHLHEPSPRIDWRGLNLEIPQQALPWPAEELRLAGVSSFGITGTNAHAILAAAPPGAGRASAPVLPAAGSAAASAVARAAAPAAAPVVVTVSGASAAALEAAAERLLEHLSNEPGTDLGDLAYTTCVRRDQHAHRLALVGETLEEITGSLAGHLSGEAVAGAIAGERGFGSAPAFVFSGQGSQWPGMGGELLGWAQVFTATLSRCASLLRPLVDWSPEPVLSGQAEGLLERVDVVQPALCSFQIALAAQLHAWGIEPGAVVGHSMGEVAAAQVAGALSLRDALRLIVVRSRLLAEIAGRGDMALLDLEQAEAEARIAGAAGALSIAACNGPRTTVVAGDPAQLDALLAALDAEGIFCRRVQVGLAAHSAQTDPLLPRLTAALAGLEVREPTIPFYSTARPGSPTNLTLDAAYWADNLRRPVQLLGAVRNMMAAGIGTYVEVSPHPVLLTSLSDIAADVAAGAGQPMRVLAGLRRKEPERRRLLELLAQLHVTGVAVDWLAVLGGHRTLVPLPSYPWQRERCWPESWEDWSGHAGEAVAAPRPELASSAVHVVDWVAHRVTSLASAAGRWVIVGGGAVARELAMLVRAEGGEVCLVRDEREAEASLLWAGEALAGVVQLRALEAGCGSSAAEFEAGLERALGSASRLLRAQQRAGSRVRASTLLATCGVQSAGGRRALLSSLPQATLWGLARTAAPDNPGLNLRIADLPADAPAAEMARQLWSIARDESGENQYASGPAGLFVARLRPAAPDLLARPARWRPDATYLITGGLGDLGLAVAAELVRGGARRLVLNARTALPPREDWLQLPAEHPQAARVRAVMELERSGASVQLASFDVAEEAALREFVSRYHAAGWPPIRGVVHCAGALTAGHGSWESFRALAAGKVIGAFNLHRALPELEQLVLFSSIASVLPQYNIDYAAANAVLDALAEARRAAGLPAVSLSWSAWGSMGVLRDAAVARTVELLAANGIYGFDREEAPALFRWAAAAEVPHVVLAPLDGSALVRALCGRPGAALFAALEGASAEAGGPGRSQPGATRVAVLALPERERPAALAARVGRIAAEVLQLNAGALSTTRALGEQGLDSLLAVELRNRLERELGLRLAASLAWNYPTVELLAQHLLELLSADPAAAPAGAGPQPTGSAVADWGDPVTGAMLEAPPGAAPLHEVGAAAVLAGLAGQSDEELIRQLRGDVA